MPPMSQDSYRPHMEAGNALVREAQHIATADFTQARALGQAAG